MYENLGDRSKQPPECRPLMYTNNKCPNLKEVGGGFEGERYRCEVCGASFFIDYDEIR